MSITHASIVPLIGGETIGSQQAFGTEPLHFMSYDGFQANDSHILNYYDNRIKYYLLDQGEAPPVNERADVVSSVCPCAGLSMMSHGYGDHNPNNQWMGKTAEYILGEYKPKVFWGENAPAFAGKIGTNVRAQLREIGKKNGYTMSVYRTRSLLHGAPQVRERSFYFFWKDTQTPLLGYFNRPHKPIEEVIRGVTSNFQMEPISNKTPSDNPYYKFILDEIHGGRTHKEHSELVESKFTKSGLCVFTYIERNGYNFKQVSEWMTKHGYDNEAEKSMRKYEKLKSGGNIMKRGVTIPKDYIGAFVGHYPKMLTHPDEDRFITYREAMTIMGLPQDFELLNPKQSSNHICQNVPVQTAADMAGEVKKYIEGNAKMVDTDYIMQYNHSQKADYITNADTLEAFI
jgi:site-specific DNA-cytosine methylase|tara:strand:+ start:3719 stop:4921 length:1203 start_codon:yes stop_codon:yes gene_type:complete